MRPRFRFCRVKQWKNHPGGSGADYKRECEIKENRKNRLLLEESKRRFLWGILHKNLQNSSEEWKCYSIYEIFIGHFIFLVLDFIHNISGERIFLFISMFSSLFLKNKSR